MVVFILSGCAVGAGNTDGSANPTDHEHSDGILDPAGTGHDHHGTTEWDGQRIPTIEVQVQADTEGGVNVGVATTDFVVEPPSASTGHIAGQGHFHLLIDGVKTQRFYNDWVHVPGVPAGEVEIKVGLSTNDHRTYTLNGEPITDAVVFVVPEHSHSSHSHERAAMEVVGTAPVLGMSVWPDPESGFNVVVSVQGLALEPRAVGGEHADGEGHLHLYANGLKIARLYGTAVHVPEIGEGDVELTVAAFTNDHRPYVIDGSPVEVTTIVTVDS